MFLVQTEILIPVHEAGLKLKVTLISTTVYHIFKACSISSN